MCFWIACCGCVRVWPFVWMCLCGVSRVCSAIERGTLTAGTSLTAVLSPHRTAQHPSFLGPLWAVAHKRVRQLHVGQQPRPACTFTSSSLRPRFMSSPCWSVWEQVVWAQPACERPPHSCCVCSQSCRATLLPCPAPSGMGTCRSLAVLEHPPSRTTTEIDRSCRTSPDPAPSAIVFFFFFLTVTRGVFP